MGPLEESEGLSNSEQNDDFEGNVCRKLVIKMKFEEIEVGKEYWTYLENALPGEDVIQRLRVSVKENNKVYFAFSVVERWQYLNKEEVEDFVFETKEEAKENF